MGLLTGCNHIAVVTQDIERFVAFYTGIFDGALIADMTEGEIRHVMLDLGGVVLHPFQFPGDQPHGIASSEMFDRGHIDHYALNVADAEVFEELRRRLVAAGATDGTVTDFGITRNVWFEDPDGMGCEIAMWGRGQPLPFNARIEEAYQPRPALG